MKNHGFSEHGIPILSLSDKIEGLRYCLENDHPEDAMGHLFDLIYYLAPDGKFLCFENVVEIARHYGSHPTPIVRD
jgi:hypothetical protein